MEKRLIAEIEEIVLDLIELEGFTTESEILCTLLENRHYKTKYKVEIRKTVLEMSKKYSIVNRRLNKELKKKLNIQDITGYPLVIYKK